MKVKDLMEHLQKMDPESEVVMASDREGNNMSPCDKAEDEYIYTPETTWYGEIHSREDCDTEEEWKERCSNSKTVNAVVLWPVN